MTFSLLDMYARVIALMLLLASASQGYAQSNLAYDTTLYIHMSGTIPANGMDDDVELASRTITVPAGRVLKVEEIRESHFDANGNPVISWNRSMWVTLDTVIIAQRGIYNVGLGAWHVDSDRPPIWLPEGTYTFKLYAESRSGDSFPSRGLALISAIQFAILP